MTKVPASTAARTRKAAAVSLPLMLAMNVALAGCAYEYDEGSSGATASAPPFTGGALPQDPATRWPVSGVELDAWLAQVLPATEGQVFHTGYGTLAAGEEREETTSSLPPGSYAITLACRSPRRVSFTVRHDDTELVDLHLRCGKSRVNVVYLPADSVLTFNVEANAGANFAYRVSRI
jgi:hypothetical protein